MARTSAAVLARPQLHRFRVSVPDADQAVLAWLAAQDNVSVSLRLLVREQIERDGYVDVLTRPVVQLPRRGRPPGSSRTVGESDDEDLAAEQGRAPDAEAIPRTADTVAASAAREPGHDDIEVGDALVAERQHVDEPQPPANEPAVREQSASVSAPAAAPSAISSEPQPARSTADAVRAVLDSAYAQAPQAPLSASMNGFLTGAGASSPSSTDPESEDLP